MEVVSSCRFEDSITEKFYHCLQVSSLFFFISFAPPNHPAQTCIPGPGVLNCPDKFKLLLRVSVSTVVLGMGENDSFVGAQGVRWEYTPDGSPVRCRALYIRTRHSHTHLDAGLE